MRPTHRLACVVVSLAAIALAPSAPAGADDAAPATLRAGHALVAETNHSMLSNGWYSLDVSPESATLYETIPVPGADGPSLSTTGTWFRDDPRGYAPPKHDHTRLWLRRDGDLVLVTAGGRRLWHSGTKGSGAVRLTLHKGGLLALHARSGEVVWSSGSGQVQMSGGMVLGPGERLRSGWESAFGRPSTTLTMQRNGNLVHRCGSRIDWQTHTHVRGSSLRMFGNGALRIVGPTGRLVWSAHSGDRDQDYATFQSDSLSIHASGHLVWSANTNWKVC